MNDRVKIYLVHQDSLHLRCQIAVAALEMFPANFHLVIGNTEAAGIPKVKHTDVVGDLKQRSMLVS